MPVTNELQMKALRVIADFEGGWDGVAGNFDGMTLSYGPLQWNIGQGTLQPLLRQMATTHADVLGRMTSPAFTVACQSDPSAFIRTYILTPSGFVTDVWKTRLKALAQTPEMSAIFLAGAQSYLRRAEAFCLDHSLTTERAYLFAFDRAVQQGSAKRGAVERAIQIAQGLKYPEYAVLKVAAKQFSVTSNYPADVLSRALSIALGSSKASELPVHGQNYDETTYGISYDRKWNV